MDDESLELVKRVASEIDAKVYKEPTIEQSGTTLKFKTTSELMAAMKVLKPMHFFSVFNLGHSHFLEFRSIAEANKAAETLKRELYANSR